MRRPMARWLAVAAVGLALLAGSLMATLGAAAATMVYVAPSGSGGGSCATPDYTSIQDAVNVATAGDTVLVCAGIYNENVTINTPLTLAGAQAGVSVDERTVGGPAESIINGIGTSAIRVNVSGVTIDGFTVTNTDGLAGIYANEQSDITIANNFVTNVINPTTAPAIGIYIHSFSASIHDVLIEHNDISDIHQTGGRGSAQGILVGDTNGTTTIEGLVIRWNTISAVTARTDDFPVGHGAYGIQLNYGTSGGSTPNAQITDNAITNLEGLWAHGIGLEGDTPFADVERNSISQLIDHKSPSDAAAVNIEDNDSARTITLRFNNFSDVNIGVQNNTNDPVNAKFNWWGCSRGPSASGCATTVGRVVSLPVLRNAYVNYVGENPTRTEQIINNLLNGGFSFLNPRSGR